MTRNATALLALPLIAASPTALAHPAHGPHLASFWSGMVHAMSAPEHLIVLLAMAVLMAVARQQGVRRLKAWIAVFSISLSWGAIHAVGNPDIGDAGVFIAQFVFASTLLVAGFQTLTWGLSAQRSPRSDDK